LIHGLTMKASLLNTTRLLAILLILGIGIFPGLTQSQVSFDFERFHRLMQERFGDDRTEIAEAWKYMLHELADLPDEEKIKRVSRFFHRNLGQDSDMNIWGVEDYWATPLETMGMGKGDCNDWAIAKYYSLRIAGIDDDSLRLIYTTAEIRSGWSSRTEPHMVLGYYPEAGSVPLIMDNIDSRVRLASQRRDLRPVFSFNSEGMWQGAAGASTGGSSTASLSSWGDLLNRARDEGIAW
jgi:predicted transglutaminase-like cysteine proteinase